VALAPGTRLGGYEILALIGSGGMGEVYRARDARLGRDVAVKILAAEFAGDRDRSGRFDHEARAAASLNHPNILAVYDVGTYDGTPYIVSELLDGETLRERVARGALAVRAALEIVSQLARGLAAAHGPGIVHRDLKPDNVFVTRDNLVKILDFGLAKSAPMAVAGMDVTRAPETLHGAVGTVLGFSGDLACVEAENRLRPNHWSELVNPHRRPVDSAIQLGRATSSPQLKPMFTGLFH
jgi:serine/threonine protein kinase